MGQASVYYHNCLVCQGRGRIPCPSCSGVGAVREIAAAVVAGGGAATPSASALQAHACSGCRGTGAVSCAGCQGHGIHGSPAYTNPIY